jgi:hypothetical protein
MFALILLVCCFALVACSTAKAPAEAAIKATEEALAGVRQEASVYVPDQLKAVEDALAAAKADFEQKEYQKALTEAQDLPGKVKDLSAAIAIKKDQLAKSWKDMSGGLPGMVEAIQSRINMLSKSRRLPAGLTKDNFESAKTTLEQIKQTWTDATGAFQSGNLMDAVTKANDVKTKAVEIMNVLGMQVPEAAL